MKEVKVGGYINTPRFLQCRISAIFENEKLAYECGFSEPTHFNETSEVKDVLGKHIGTNLMIFGVILKSA